METTVFLIAAAICLVGAVGVIFNRNPVHAALSLVATLFGIAVLFVAQEAHFLAAVQVIVYAGAIVVLFLFVIMLLGVDLVEDLSVEPLTGQRVAAVLLALVVAVLPVVALAQTGWEATGARSVIGSITESERTNIAQLGEALFTDYLLAFEITSVLLVIAVVGAVVVSRRPTGEEIDVGEPEQIRPAGSDRDDSPAVATQEPVEAEESSEEQVR